MTRSKGQCGAGFVFRHHAVVCRRRLWWFYSFLLLFTSCFVSVAFGPTTPLSPAPQRGGTVSDEPMNDDVDTSHPLWVVDAFVTSSTKGGTGNPAGVVLFQEDVTQDMVDGEWVEWLAMVARQVNHAETAFLWKLPGHNEYGIRYYTCTGSEVPLCGHATLTSAGVLAGLVPKETTNEPTTMTFQARRNTLQATDVTTEEDLAIHPTVRRISMNFPWRSVTRLEDEETQQLVRHRVQTAFPWAASATTKEDFLFMGVDHLGEDLLVEVTPQAFARWLNPPSDSDSTILYPNLLPSALNHVFSRGVILCSLAENNPEVDFVSRFFSPSLGIPEDPVTGTAHCTLAAHFGPKCAKSTLVGRQESPRGGAVKCRLLPEEKQVELVGTTKVALEGKLLL